MQRRLGIENGLQRIVFLALCLLIIITPLGHESSNPIIFGLYRTLLFLIIVAVVRTPRHEQQSVISRSFLMAVATFVFLLAVSLMIEKGSHFEGKYVFYEHV